MAIPRYDGPLPPRRGGREARRVTARDAIATLPDRARVHVATGCAPPTLLLDALVRERDRFSRLDLVLPYTLEPLPVLEDGLGDPFFVTALHPAGALRPFRDHPAFEVIPSSVTQWDSVMARDGIRPVDVSLVQVTPPGPEGRVSLGVNGGETAQIARRAPRLIAQINPAMPYTFGASELARDEIDLYIDGEEALIEQITPTPSALDRRVAEFAAGEIENGSVLQFGIGTLPVATLEGLCHHKNLGVHGGMVGDPVIDLAEAGVINGTSKSRDPGLMVSAGGLGTRRLFDWMHRNERLLIAPAAYSHHPSVLATHERFTAINSAVEVALDGSTNSEWVAGKAISGPGGQPDFVMGANASPGGRSLIALPSTAAGGRVSRIVRELAAGTPSTLPRYLADRVITEHGVARLKHLPLRERARALHAIADPAFQDDLADS